MVNLRPATIDDILDMSKLWVALVMEENPNANPDSQRWIDIERKMFDLKDYYAFVVEENGNVVGFNDGLLLTDLETNEPYIQGGSFYVLPQYRKGPCGIKLHRNSFQVARNIGAKFLRRKVSANNKRMVDRFIKMDGKKHFIKEYIVDEMIGGTK